MAVEKIKSSIFFRCEFVLQQKGEDFVQSIFNECPNLNRPIIRNPSLKFKPSLVQACAIEEIPSLVEWHMKNSKVVKFVAKMGFERGLVSETLKNVLTKNKSAKFDSCFELVESILQTESNLASLCGELRALSLG